MVECTDCGSTNILLRINIGECFCENCGLVLKDQMCSDQRSNLKPLSIVPVDPPLKRLVSYNYSGRERYNYKITIRIKHISERLKLPSFIPQHAYAMYLDLSYHGLCNGRNLDVIFHSCVYVSCQLNRIPRTIEEITDYSGVRAASILQYVNFIKRKLNLTVPITDPVDLVSRFISILKLSHKCERITVDILNRLKNNPKYAGRKPKTKLAGAIYLACRLCHIEISLMRIAVEICLREDTIRKISHEMTQDINLELYNQHLV